MPRKKRQTYDDKRKNVIAKLIFVSVLLALVLLAFELDLPEFGRKLMTMFANKTNARRTLTKMSLAMTFFRLSSYVCLFLRGIRTILAQNRMGYKCHLAQESSVF
jgi:formate-dependent nitrite reductase membrane component NrfD